MTVKKKILIVCDSSKSLLDFRGKLIEKMQEKNQVFVFTPHITQDFTRDRLYQMGVIVKENKLNGSNISILSDLRFILSLYKLIKNIKPDILFPYTFKPVIYGTLLAKICKIKLIAPMLTGLGYNFTDGNVTNKLVVNITKLLLKFSLKPNSRLNIIFHNKDDAEKLLMLKILNKKHKIHIVNGSGVDLSHYSYTKPNINSITFLMVSRLINAKGLNEYFKAAKIIQSKYPQTIFKLIGDYDKNIDSISKELYQQLISGESIQYLGHVIDVRPAIESSSVVVLPSYREGLPRCILESMAMGRAIITCDSAGCRETVNQQNGMENGFLVPVKDPIALASKMEYFILNKDNIINYGNKGLAFAKEKFDVNLINNDMFRIMQLEN
jgi:glycosyltransferase involved in cell wall biosynthesis